MHETDSAAVIAGAMLNFRRERSEMLPAELFSEPAWDLLLSLFVADAESRRITGRDVSQQSGIPPSVTARWLMHLTKIGLIVGDGSGDLDDPLTLSAEALESMENVMAKARSLQAAIS